LLCIPEHAAACKGNLDMANHCSVWQKKGQHIEQFHAGSRRQPLLHENSGRCLRSKPGSNCIRTALQASPFSTGKIFGVNRHIATGDGPMGSKRLSVCWKHGEHQAKRHLSTGATVLGPPHSIARDATLAVNYERNVDNPQADQESCTESCPLFAAPQLSSAVFSPN